MISWRQSAQQGLLSMQRGVLGVVLACGTAVSVLGTAPAVAQELRIGYVNSERILRESTPAKAAGQKLDQEFAKRDRELQDMAAKLKSQAERFEKDGPVLSEADRSRRQRELIDMDRDLQRRQRELREDLNQRRNEEWQALLEKTQKVVRQIAEQEKFDLILQDAVYFSPRVDITDKVLRQLNNGK
jgi:outer membrane protein